MTTHAALRPEVVRIRPGTHAPLVAVRRSSVSAGTLEYRATGAVSGWHEHDLHEIEYAVSGVAGMQTSDTHYVLPPLHAAWIPAGVPHCPVLEDVTTIAVFFDPDRFQFGGGGVTIIQVSAVLREMIRYATRWPIQRQFDDPEASAFFVALADVVNHQLAHMSPFALPASDDAIAAEVMTYTLANLADVTATAVCRAIGISERTLRRRFPEVVGQTWREYLQQARLCRAMALLSVRRRSIADVAATVGFESPSAFARAFRAWTGESPTAYRARWLPEGAPTDR